MPDDRAPAGWTHANWCAYTQWWVNATVQTVIGLAATAVGYTWMLRAITVTVVPLNFLNPVQISVDPGLAAGAAIALVGLISLAAGTFKYETAIRYRRARKLALEATYPQGVLRL